MLSSYYPRRWNVPKQNQTEEILFRWDPVTKTMVAIRAPSKINAPPLPPALPLAPSLYIATFLSTGTPAGGVCVDSSGNVYISIDKIGSIIKVDIYRNVSTYVTGLLGFLSGICVDSYGNLYVTLGRSSYVSKIDTSKNVTTFAGTYNDFGNDGDGGQATSALLDSPIAICVDINQNVYIADNFSNCIRKVATDGIISTVTTGTLDAPQGVCVDSLGNLYISDSNNYRVLKVTPLGIVSTFAGILSNTGVYSLSHENQPATSVPIGKPFGICADSSGNIYFSTGHSRIRKVDTSGKITSIVGNGTAGFSGDGGLATAASIRVGELAIDSNNNLYLCDGINNRVRIYYA